MASNKPKILLGLPTMSSIHTWLMVDIASWMSDAFNKGKYNLSMYPTMSVQPVDNARNEIVTEFLKSDCTHLLFIDADTIPPQNVIDKMLEHDVPIITAITPIVEYDEKSQMFYKKWNCVDLNDKHVKPNTGVVEVKGAGASCIMIKREVFEKIERPYYRFLYQDDSGKDVCVSEDIYFIAKAVGAGYKCLADTSLICKHYKSTIW